MLCHIRIRLSTNDRVTLIGRGKIMRGMVVNEVSGEISDRSLLYVFLGICLIDTEF
jgi:hypothetical protein